MLPRLQDGGSSGVQGVRTCIRKGKRKGAFQRACRYSAAPGDHEHDLRTLCTVLAKGSTAAYVKRYSFLRWLAAASSLTSSEYSLLHKRYSIYTALSRMLEGLSPLSAVQHCALAYMLSAAQPWFHNIYILMYMDMSYC